MDQAFGWIGDLLRWLVRLVPRWDICRATHGGVKFVRGSKVRPIRPGIYWWWPAVTETVIVPTARQSVNIPAQSLTTTDGRSVLISVVLVIEIMDVVKALGRSWDVDDTVTEVGAAAAVEIVARRKWTELKTAVAEGEVNDELVSQARNLLRPYGVRVLKGRITDCARHVVIRNVGGGAVVPVPQEADTE